MNYKKLDLTDAVMCNVEEEAAKAFIDMRLSIKKPLTPRSFKQNMQKAALCEQEGICTATEAVDIAVDSCWQGVKPEWVRNALRRDMGLTTINHNWKPSQEAYAAISASGISYHFANELLHNFIIYWSDSMQAKASWDSTFVTHVKHQWARRPEAGTLTKDQPISNQLVDRSWAH